MAAAPGQRDDDALQALLVVARESVRRVRRELRCRAQRRVRRITVHEIGVSRAGERLLERAARDRHAWLPQRGGHAAQVSGIADGRIRVAARRHVEGAPPVHAKQAVEAGPVQVDQHGRERRRVDAGSGGTSGVEAGVAHLVIEPVPARRMLHSQRRECRDDLLGPVAQHGVGQGALAGVGLRERQAAAQLTGRIVRTAADRQRGVVVPDLRARDPDGDVDAPTLGQRSQVESQSPGCSPLQTRVLCDGQSDSAFNDWMKVSMGMACSVRPASASSRRPVIQSSGIS